METKKLKTNAIPIHLIYAATNEGGIGNAGKIPWNIAEDRKRFKKITTTTENNNAKNLCIMGPATYLSIPEKYRKLEGRIVCIVIEDQKRYNAKPFDIVECYSVASLKNAIECIPNAIKGIENIDIENIFICGGASLYNEAFKNFHWDKIYFTLVPGEYECDRAINFTKDISMMLMDGTLKEIDRELCIDPYKILCTYITYKRTGKPPVGQEVYSNEIIRGMEDVAEEPNPNDRDDYGSIVLGRKYRTNAEIKEEFSNILPMKPKSVKEIIDLANQKQMSDEAKAHWDKLEKADAADEALMDETTQPYPDSDDELLLADRTRTREEQVALGLVEIKNLSLQTAIARLPILNDEASITATLIANDFCGKETKKEREFVTDIKRQFEAEITGLEKANNIGVGICIECGETALLHASGYCYHCFSLK